MENLLNQLQEPGEINQLLEEQEIEPGQKLQETEKNCNLCQIHKYPFNINENIYYETENFYIVETYTKKGHQTRNMAATKQHGEIPSKQEIKQIKNNLEEITAAQIRDGEMITYGSMNTFPDHYHIIASDLEGNDLQKIQDYELHKIKNGQIKHLETQKTTKTGKTLF